MTDAQLHDTRARAQSRGHARRLEQPQSVRAIFFDVGFTLLAPAPSVVEIAAGACARCGIAVDRACLQSHLPAAEASLCQAVRAAPDSWADDHSIGVIWRNYFAELLRPCFPRLAPAELSALVEAVRERFEHFSSYAVYPDVVPVLRLLHARGLKMGIISDWGTGLSAILHEHGLNRFFDFAVVSATLRHAKPHPRLFETALRRADAIPDYALHVGDSYLQDVLGARSVGITPVLIDRSHRIDLHDVDVPVVQDLFELLDLLEIESDGLDQLGGG